MLVPESGQRGCGRIDGLPNVQPPGFPFVHGLEPPRSRCRPRSRSGLGGRSIPARHPAGTGPVRGGWCRTGRPAPASGDVPWPGSTGMPSSRQSAAGPPARVWGWFEAGPRLDAIEQMPANPVAGHRLLADEAGPRDCGAHGHGSPPDDGALGPSPARVLSSPRSAIPLVQLSLPGAARPRAGGCTPPWATGSSRSRPRSGGQRSNAPPARPRSCRYTGSTPTRPFPKSLPPPLRPDGSGFSSAAGYCRKRFTPWGSLLHPPDGRRLRRPAGCA